MSSKTSSRVKKPPLLPYLFFGAILKVLAYTKGRRMLNHRRIKGPAITLSNHTSFDDFIYTFAALYPRRTTFFAAQKMFYEKGRRFFLRLSRAIPKSLMQPDPVATMAALRILQKNGIVAIFPEGQISPIGTTLPLSFSIAKFIKKAHVDVYIIKHKNAYLANPPWAQRQFKGRIETEMSLILTKEDITAISAEEIIKVVTEKLFFSTTQYNAVKRYRYRLNDIHNLENVIYQCPQCLHEGLIGHEDHLSCPACGYQMTYDVYGELNGNGIEYWYRLQEARVRQAIDADEHYHLEGEATLFSLREPELTEVGKGTLRVDKDHYTYQGTLDGKPAVLTFDVSAIQSLPSDIGRNVQIYQDYQIYQFEMPIKYLPAKFIHAGEYLYQKKHR